MTLASLGSRPALARGAALLALAASLAACTEATPSAGPRAEILWDSWGVPHIFASDTAGLFYGFGWAQARNHADLALRLYGEARGRGAEYWGEEHLDLDRWVWTVGIPGRAEAWLAAQDAEMRAGLEAFAAGFNAYAAAHREAIAEEVEVVLPVTAVDLLAHTQRVLHFTFVVDPGSVAAAGAELATGRAAAGSNGWAIGPRRSASGNALLVANPHLPWADLFTWFEAQLVTDGLDAYGAALVGMPFLGIAFNDALGWTHTVNTHDGYDLFELVLAGEGYRYDGEVLPFETEEVTLAVRQASGEPRLETLRLERSLHGPVVARGDGTALALGVVGLEAAQLPRQYWDMARATDLAGFEAAVRRMQMPMFTFLYADRAGNILHHFGGETPIRPRGDWATWARPVPGDSSEWTWSGIHAFDELPTALNPASGWLQNANDPPWTTSFPSPLDADDFPAYMAPRFMHARAQRSAGMLIEDDSITFEEVVAYKLSTRMELAERILDDLERAVAEHGDDAAREAMTVLAAWDRAADADSRGAALFVEFCSRMHAAGSSLATPGPAAGFARAWSPDEPLATPDGLADPAAAARALSSAARDLRERHGRLDVEWGRIHRLRRAGHDHPANGGPGWLGTFRVASFQPEADGTARVAAGDSWVAIVEFGEPTRAAVLLSYGNASQPGSPHDGDQLELFARKELREAWRDRAEIEAHLERREILDPPVGGSAG